MFNVKLISLLVCSSLLVAACATPEQQARLAAQQQAEQQAIYQAIVRAIKDRCTQFGYKEGTDSFARCIQEETRAVEAYAQAQQMQSTKERDAYYCSQGVTQACSGGTNCSRDFSGNVTCNSW